MKPYDEAIRDQEGQILSLLLARLSNFVNFHEDFCWLIVLYTKAKRLPAKMSTDEEQFEQDVPSLNNSSNRENREASSFPKITHSMRQSENILAANTQS